MGSFLKNFALTNFREFREIIAYTYFFLIINCTHALVPEFLIFLLISSTKTFLKGFLSCIHGLCLYCTYNKVETCIRWAYITSKHKMNVWQPYVCKESRDNCLRLQYMKQCFVICMEHSYIWRRNYPIEKKSREFLKKLQ